MVDATKDKEIQSEDDLSWEGLKQNYQRKQDLLDSITKAIVKAVPWTLWTIILLLLLTSIGLLLHFIFVGDWKSIESIVKNVTTYTITFLFGLLVRNKIIS